MKWSAIARGSLAAMVVGALLPAAAARAQLADFCPVPGMTMAPVYPLRLTGLEELNLIRHLSSPSAWHVEPALTKSQPQPVADESTARYEDGTPKASREPAAYAYEQRLPLVIALFRETVGGQIATRLIDQLTDLAEALEGATDEQFVFAPQASCGKLAHEQAVKTLDVCLPPELSGPFDYPQLSDDLRHSLGNDDVLAINARENGHRPARVRPDAVAGMESAYRGPWYAMQADMFNGCGGLGMPPVAVAMQPAPAAAIDLSDLAEPRSTEDRRELARLAQPGMQQLLDVAGVILHHLGSGLLDVAEVLSPRQREQAPAVVQPDLNEQSASMPSDLHLGL